MKELDLSNIPQHIAVVMDGNGRWAKKRLQPRLFGHRAGMKALHDTVKIMSDLGVKYLSVYAFSTENWKRSEEEVSGLMNIAVEYFFKEIDELNANNVKVVVIGDKAELPAKVREAAAGAEAQTAGNTGLTFNVALNYGGRADVVQAVRRLAADGKDMTAVTETDITDHLYTAGQPDPDIMLRTGGEHRLSNFMLWQNSYSEYFFEDILWPDVNKDFFVDILRRYQNRDRRFGNVK